MFKGHFEGRFERSFRGLREVLRWEVIKRHVFDGEVLWERCERVRGMLLRGRFTRFWRF